MAGRPDRSSILPTSCKNGQAAGADTIKQRSCISANPDDHVKYALHYLEMGFTTLFFHSAGPDQRAFLEGYGRDVLPRIRQEVQQRGLGGGQGRQSGQSGGKQQQQQRAGAGPSSSGPHPRSPLPTGRGRDREAEGDEERGEEESEERTRAHGNGQSLRGRPGQPLSASGGRA